MTKKALIVGASGIVGSATAKVLGDDGWQVLGLSRTPQQQNNVTPVAADLLDPASLSKALAGLDPSHVFISSWLRQSTEAENIRVNSSMVRNVLDALSPAGSVKHVALVTGLKHYLGPFENYGKGALPQTPFREEQGRLEVDNFYYAQEDEVFAAAARDGTGCGHACPPDAVGQARPGTRAVRPLEARHARGSLESKPRSPGQRPRRLRDRPRNRRHTSRSRDPCRSACRRSAARACRCAASPFHTRYRSRRPGARTRACDVRPSETVPPRSASPRTRAPRPAKPTSQMRSPRCTST